MNILNKQQIVDLANEFVSSDKFNSSDDCKNSVRSFVNWVKNNKGFEPDVMLLAPPKDIKKFPGKSKDGDSHIFSIIGGYGIDFTAKQFDSNQPLIKIIPESEIESEYKKLGGYFTSYPDWFEGGKTSIKSKFNNLPQWFHNGYKKDMNLITENRHSEFGCLMAIVEPTRGPHIIKFGKTVIPPQILYTDPNDSILSEIRRRCDCYKNEDKYPDYKPHMTLAYVQKGKFPHIKEGLNISVPVTRFKYSGQDGKKLYINL